MASQDYQQDIQEIFSSLQGEGICVGRRQIFVRFTGCNLSCKYCDTVTTGLNVPFCRIEKEPGTGIFSELPNPLTAVQTADEVNAFLRQNTHQMVSFTGGEPLLHPEFIKQVAMNISAPVFLETNGILVQSLAKIIDVVDIISMDIKLPQATGRQLWNFQKNFLRLATKKKVYVKVVVTADTSAEEFMQAVRLTAEISADIPFVIQPVTPFGGCKKPLPIQLLAWQQAAAEILSDVRVIPQTHKIMDLL